MWGMYLHHRDNQPRELIFAGCLVADRRSWCGKMVIDWCNHKIHKGSDSLPGKELALPANHLKKDIFVFFWFFENYLTFRVLRLCVGNLPWSFKISCVHISNIYIYTYNNTGIYFIFKQPSTSFRLVSSRSLAVFLKSSQLMSRCLGILVTKFYSTIALEICLGMLLYLTLRTCPCRHVLPLYSPLNILDVIVQYFASLIFVRVDRINHFHQLSKFSHGHAGVELSPEVFFEVLRKYCIFGYPDSP